MAARAVWCKPPVQEYCSVGRYATFVGNLSRHLVYKLSRFCATARVR